MRFNVRFRVEGRLGAKSIYSLRAVCTYLVDRYSLKEKEITRIVTMPPGETFTNEDMEITRLELTASPRHDDRPDESSVKL